MYSTEVEEMMCIAKGPNHGPSPIPEEGKWVQVKGIKDISGLTHGVGWCAPQQGACKLTLNIKAGIIEEALVETIGCTGMTHSAAMASEILPGKTGLRHVSEMDYGYVDNVDDYVKPGDTIKVKLLEMKDGGKLRLSRKPFLEKPEGYEERPPRPRHNGDRQRGGDRDRRRGGRHGGGGRNRRDRR